MKSIDLICPEVFAGKGGIQTYSQTLIRGLTVVRPNLSLRVFIRNDHRRHIPTTDWKHIDWHPCSGSNTNLVVALTRAALLNPGSLVISTFPRYHPLQRLYRRINGVEQWCTAHGKEIWRSRPSQLHGLAKLDRILPVSHFTASWLSQHYGNSMPPISLLPNSYNDQRYQPGPYPEDLRNRYGFDTGQPIIFCLSRLLTSEPYKNIDALIRSLPSVLAIFPKVHLLIAGEGDDRHRLTRLSHDLGIQKSVTFTGKVVDSELADHFRLATLFALPSEEEGFGIVFLEAMGSGCPVLAGNRDGSFDPLAGGEFGMLVDPRQPLAPALQALLEGRGRDLWFDRLALGAAVKQRFGFDAFCHHLDALLSQHEISDPQSA